MGREDGVGGEGKEGSCNNRWFLRDATIAAMFVGTGGASLDASSSTARGASWPVPETVKR